MPEEQSDNQPVKIQKGQLAPWDAGADPVELEEDEKTALKELCSRAAKRDMASRRFEVEQAWEARLFDRGYHYLLPRKGGGWVLPQESTGFGIRSQQIASLLETNIYTPYETIITSALTRKIPGVKFQPKKPDDDRDITAAETAEDYRKVFARSNDLPSMHTDMARYLWTDGRAHIYTRHVIDAQRFGYEEPDEDEAVVPEDETSNAGASQSGGSPDNGGGISGMAESAESISAASRRPSDDDNLRGQEGESSEVTEVEQNAPRGEEISDVYGKLEVKVPMNTKKQADWWFLQFSLEYDTAIVKANFPDIADSIEPSAGPGENELDRIARINTALALAASYVTGDAMQNDCTVQKTWFRPSAFMSKECEQVRDSLLKKFPKGCLVVHAGKTFAFARPENMDDRWVLVKATRSDGMNAAGLGAWMISLQKRVNNWIDLLNDFFIRTVPKKYMDSEAFNVEAIRQQTQIPGDITPFKAQPGLSADQLIFVEPTPQHQPELPLFIEKFANELAQLLSGGYPALAGGDTGGNDTMGGIAMQRDQAMGRLGTCWHSIQGATAEYHRQAVQCAAQSRAGKHIKESVPGTDSVLIELEDLKGNILCYPEADSSFPESWTERQQRFTMLFADATKNPIVMGLLQMPKNLKLAKDAVGLADFDVPQADSVDKQLGEFEILLKTAPMPNPKLQQADQLLKQMQADPQAAPQIQQLRQAMSQIPQLVSSVPIDEQCDDHDAEAQTCLEFINSPKGRKLKNGSPEEKAAFQNVRLHFLEHDAIRQKNKAAAAQAAQKQKVAESLAFKDAPPDLQVQIAADAGHTMKPPVEEPTTVQ